MNNILILGSGRSGTSMLTGILVKSGFHLGENFEYLKKDKANPKGYFEDYEVNTVNEDILKENLISIPETLRKWIFPSFTFYRARWLAVIPKGKKIKTTSSIDNRIEVLINKPSFCYKDPRFSYTLPIWKKLFKKNNIAAKYLVVYREPFKTANSIVRECEENKALHPLKMTSERALKVWESMYSHILENYEKDIQKENWMFVHFNQLFSLEVLEKIEEFIGGSIDKQFPEKQLSRAEDLGNELSPNLSGIYNQLKKYSF
ncbi:sulfotransferase [Flavobacterium sp. 5]|uniref:sulfotransferase n=1 Tax=Flavobacterium sp. 5 TaxID=2035199 RepID=UPI000C2C0065|nr:sulfotransferase [Flavobacterium sp. 5]PKB17449.1 sulfotransferase family protein [Flavobacterium sp. 5]